MMRLPSVATVALALLAAAPLGAQGDAPLLGRTVAEWTDDLANPQPVVRQAAAEALARGGRDAIRAVPALTGLVIDPDLAVRRTAIRALGALGPAAARSERVLWAAWREDDALVAADAGIALLAVAPRTSARFRALLDTSDARTRARAAAALARATPSRGTIHALRDRLADDDARVRGATLAALDALDARPGRTTATRIGEAILHETRTLPVLAADDAASRVATAVRILARAGRDADGASRALQRLVWDAPPALRTDAARVLGRIPGAGDAALATALAAGGAAVREAALAGLLADRERRRDLGAVTDTLRRMAAPLDSARAVDLVVALGYVARRTRTVERTLGEVVQCAPMLAGAVQEARRRLALGL